jgi:hypothetical protein
LDPLEAQLLEQADELRPTFWHRLRSDLVTSSLPAGPHELVDVGAGAGLLGLHLARVRPDVRYRFVEELPSLEAALERRFGPDANAARRGDHAGVGVVTLLDVLEHQADDRRFLRDLASKMDPAARLILTVPAMRALWSGWDVALGHHRRYDWRSLMAVVRAAGLLPREVSYVFPELVPPAFARVLVRSENEAADEAAFPRFPEVVDRTLYAIGRASMRLRRWWPAGTSLFAVADRPQALGTPATRRSSDT